MKLAAFVCGLATLLAGAYWASCGTAAEAPRPNIILIFSDDYGIPGVKCYGGNYATPNLDALAAGGIRFKHCFSMPLCGPSRGVTMSGRYPFRSGVLTNGSGQAYAPQNSPSIAKTLQAAGYATAVAGKWRQLQYFETPEDAKAWGFDEFIVWGAGKGERYWQPDYNLNGKPIGDVGGKYGPDILHEFVVDFIRRHKDGPFFVYYPTPLIHSPLLHTPDSKESEVKGGRYAENVAYLDKLVGKLAAELDTLGLRKNTLIVFTGDNGSVGKGEIDGKAVAGAKGSMLEGGSRVPLIVNWPGVTPAGKVLDDLVDFSDFYTTFAELAGAKLPEGVQLDGHSFAPQLRGEKGQPRESVFVQLGAEWYARNQSWKLTQAGELFDLHDAPFVEKPVPTDGASAQAQAARQQLQAALDKLNPAGGKAAQPGVNKKAKKAKKKTQATE